MLSLSSANMIASIDIQRTTKPQAQKTLLARERVASLVLGLVNYRLFLQSAITSLCIYDEVS